MRAFWLDEASPEDGSRAIGAGELGANDVLHRTLTIGAHEAALESFMREHGYTTRDEVNLNAATPELDSILARFDKEHLHTDDEVRFVVTGGGVFDIRSRDDRWMRVVVGPGDLLVVPKNRHHRFFLTRERAIHAVRLFVDRAGWTPHYR